MVREVLQAHITDITMINIVGLDIVANAEDSVIRDVEETIIDLNLTKSVKPHVLKNPPHHHMHPPPLHHHHMNLPHPLDIQHRNQHHMNPPLHQHPMDQLVLTMILKSKVGT